MDIDNLIKKLKKNNIITTLVGEFKFVKQIGEGGNSNVCLYSKNDIEFAIKFFSKGIDDSSKNSRFIDEFFCLSQISSHTNIARYFHLDNITVEDENYMIIIMKKYKSSLKEKIHLEQDQEIYSNKIRVLFDDLLCAIHHLHKNKIIHRDIKPQNILLEESNEHYVLSDFGISKFDPDTIAKESETKDGERLANYRYCAPEQRGSATPASFSSDLYSFAQVIQEYATGDINHGGGRTQVKFQDIEYLMIVDKVINRCLMHSPNERFQCVEEIHNFMEKEKKEYKENIAYVAREKYTNELWEFLHKYNENINKGFPAIKNIGVITDPIKIERFFINVDSIFNIESFKDKLWMIESNGNDLEYYGAKKINNGHYELNYGDFIHQTKISKVFIHYDEYRPYRSLFVIVIEALPQFEYMDITDISKSKTRTNFSSDKDFAIDWNGVLLDPNDVSNRYIEIEDVVYENDRKVFKPVYRFIKKEAFIVSPRGVIDIRINQNVLAKKLLANIIKNDQLTNEDISSYWTGVGGNYTNEIAMRL